jgi:hypothetical protein
MQQVHHLLPSYRKFQNRLFLSNISTPFLLPVNEARILHISNNNTHYKHHVRSSSYQIHETTHNLFIASLVHFNSTFILHKPKARNNRVIDRITFVHSKSLQHL